MFLLLLRYIYLIMYNQKMDNGCKEKVEKIVHGDYHGNGNLLVVVKKSPKLLPARSFVLCIEEMIFEKNFDFAEYLKTLSDSEDQSYYDDLDILERRKHLRESNYGEDFLMTCPGVLHWMAILNDSSAIEVTEIKKIVKFITLSMTSVY